MTLKAETWTWWRPFLRHELTHSDQTLYANHVIRVSCAPAIQNFLETTMYRLTRSDLVTELGRVTHLLRNCWRHIWWTACRPRRLCRLIGTTKWTYYYYLLFTHVYGRTWPRNWRGCGNQPNFFGPQHATTRYDIEHPNVARWLCTL